jgi:hypothetical protein
VRKKVIFHENLNADQDVKYISTSLIFIELLKTILRLHRFDERKIQFPEFFHPIRIEYVVVLHVVFNLTTEPPILGDALAD